MTMTMQQQNSEDDKQHQLLQQQDQEQKETKKMKKDKGFWKEALSRLKTNQACENCRKMKKRCDHEVPCKRCVRTHKSCSRAFTFKLHHTHQRQFPSSSRTTSITYPSSFHFSTHNPLPTPAVPPQTFCSSTTTTSTSSSFLSISSNIPPSLLFHSHVPPSPVDCGLDDNFDLFGSPSQTDELFDFFNELVPPPPSSFLPFRSPYTPATSIMSSFSSSSSSSTSQSHWSTNPLQEVRENSEERGFVEMFYHDSLKLFQSVLPATDSSQTSQNAPLYHSQPSSPSSHPADSEPPSGLDVQSNDLGDSSFSLVSSTASGTLPPSPVSSYRFSHFCDVSSVYVPCEL